jgi:hypothetical protein
MRAAFAAYRQEVTSRAIPARDHAYAISEDEWQAFLQAMRDRGPRMALRPKRS